MDRLRSADSELHVVVESAAVAVGATHAMPSAIATVASNATHACQACDAELRSVALPVVIVDVFEVMFDTAFAVASPR